MRLRDSHMPPAVTFEQTESSPIQNKDPYDLKYTHTHTPPTWGGEKS